MPLVFWFSRLQPGVSPEAYERFVREVDYPATERIPSIVRYWSIRLQGPAAGEEQLPYDFIDLAEITDIHAYRKDLEDHPAVQEVHGQFEQFVKSVGNFWAIPVGEGTGGEG